MVPAKFETLDLLLASVMGTAAAPAQQGVDSAWLHALSMSNDLAGKFITAAFSKEIETHEYDSVKVTGFTFESEAGAQAARLTFNLLCRKLNVNTSTGTNNNTTMAAATMLAARQRIFHNQLALWLNDASGAALASGDAQAITRFTLNVTLPYVQDEIPAGASVVVEPINDGHAIVTGSITFRVYRTANATRFADLLAQTKKKATATFTGPVLSGAANYSLKFWMNDIQFNPFAPSVGAAGVVTIECPFECHEVATIPTGFTSGYTRPVTIDLINGKSSGAFA